MRSFNEVYEKIYAEKNEEFESIRKTKVRTTRIVIAGIVAIFAIFIAAKLFFLLPVISIFCLAGLIIIVSINSGDYHRKFKKEIIGTFVKECDENLTYKPEQGVNPTLYKKGGFEQYFDRYSSEDLIEGKLDNKYYVSMAEVLTQEESTDSEGNTTTTTIFHGMFGVSDCAKEIPGYIKIHSDKGFFGKIFGNKEKIEMDSSEFEKHFDVYGTNQITTMQILTADIMELLIEFKTTSKIEYELTLTGNQIYLRFFTGEVFEPNILKKSLDYDTLKRYFDIIEFIFKVTRSINKIIEETEI